MYLHLDKDLCAKHYIGLICAFYEYLQLLFQSYFSPVNIRKYRPKHVRRIRAFKYRGTCNELYEVELYVVTLV
jgi:hypothetical protein